MKKFLVSLVALASIAGAAAPAAAQPFGFDGDFGNFNRREHRAERQINACQRFGNMSHWEARSLRGQLRQFDHQLRAARWGGINRFEFVQLERSMDRIERRIRRECRDFDRFPG
jgi:hypothetical protein